MVHTYKQGENRDKKKEKRRKEKRTKKKEHTHNPSSPVHEQHASLCDFFSIINRSRKKKKDDIV